MKYLTYQFEKFVTNQFVKKHKQQQQQIASLRKTWLTSLRNTSCQSSTEKTDHNRQLLIFVHSLQLRFPSPQNKMPKDKIWTKINISQRLIKDKAECDVLKELSVNYVWPWAYLHHFFVWREWNTRLLIVFLANICNMTPFFASHGKPYETQMWKCSYSFATSMVDLSNSVTNPFKTHTLWICVHKTDVTSSSLLNTRKKPLRCLKV